jgi:hypothetical protein
MIRQIRLFKTCLFLFACAVPSTVLAEGPYLYSGSLVANPQVPEECSSYVPTAQFVAKVFFAGPTGRTIVINLESSETVSPINGKNFIGLYGTSDFEAEKMIELEDRTIELKMTGFIERGFLIFELQAVVRSSDGEVICSGLADYSGFSGG